MPAGYSSRCKTCNSPYRLQIEAWHKDGVSPFGIETRLRALGEKISYHAIENHFQEHYDVQSVVQEQYYQSQANIEKEAQERVSEIKILDDVVQDKYRLHQMLDGLFKCKLVGLSEFETPGELPKLPLSYVSLYTGCASEIRQTLKQKQEMLGEDPTSKEAATWTELIASVHSRRRSALRPGPD